MSPSAYLRRQILTGAVCFFAGLFIAIGASSVAQPYFGVGIGYGTSMDVRTYEGEIASREYFNDWRKPESSLYSAFAGYRKSFLGAEVGYIKLPTYTAYAESTNPARSTSQEIKASSAYIRANVYGPNIGVEPYGFLGYSRNKAYSKEWGVREGVEVSHEVRPLGKTTIFGLGAQYGWLRAEITRIPKAYASHWTGERTYTFVSIAAVGTF